MEAVTTLEEIITEFNSGITDIKRLNYLHTSAIYVEGDDEIKRELRHSIKAYATSSTKGTNSKEFGKNYFRIISVPLSSNPSNDHSIVRDLSTSNNTNKCSKSETIVEIEMHEIPVTEENTAKPITENNPIIRNNPAIFTGSDEINVIERAESDNEVFRPQRTRNNKKRRKN